MWDITGAVGPSGLVDFVMGWLIRTLRVPCLRTQCASALSEPRYDVRSQSQVSVAERNCPWPPGVARKGRSGGALQQSTVGQGYVAPSRGCVGVASGVWGCIDAGGWGRSGARQALSQRAPGWSGYEALRAEEVQLLSAHVVDVGEDVVEIVVH
jgi:hypothetical protein